MRLQIRTARLIVRHNNPKQSPETRPGGRGVVEGGGRGRGWCMRHQTSVKEQTFSGLTSAAQNLPTISRWTFVRMLSPTPSEEWKN